MLLELSIEDTSSVIFQLYIEKGRKSKDNIKSFIYMLLWKISIKWSVKVKMIRVSSFHLLLNVAFSTDLAN